ncbi:MAG TPA: transglycosylase domain-containing protein [Spirochaetota bacterium]|nr:transglycosylase domain-containing protein [Spirochaetota bacterium]
MKIEAVPGNPIKRTLMRALLFCRLHVWIVDNYWLRISGLRHAVLRVLFYFGGVLGREGFGRKTGAVNQFLDSFIADPGRSRYFTGADGSGGECGGYLVVAQLFREGLRNHLMNLTMRDEERLFRLDDLVAFEKDFLAEKKKAGHVQRVFTREKREEFDLFFGAEKSGADLPESYIKLFFPDFDPSEFIRNGAAFVLGKKCLFSPGETRAVMDFFTARLRMRNPRSLVHRAVPVLKKTLLAACVLYYAVFFLFDLAIALYGTSRNNYNYSFRNFSQTIDTCDSPFARRAERIYRRNHGARFDEFSTAGSTPAAGNLYRINNKSQMAVELNYGFYRSLRIQDQNGLTVVAVDREKLRKLARSDPGRYRELMDLILDKRWWESILSLADDLTGNRLGLFDRAEIPHDRICDDVTKGIMKSVEPLEWISRVNRTGDCVTLLYYKANSMKWAGIDEIPRVMIEGVILREDRRFRNTFFPLPHRGNDNLVIIPQITKKVLRKVFREARVIAAARGIPWLEKQSRRFEDAFAASFKEDARGGSSISNQVMEMLYTKYITAIAEKPSFSERQIEQKKHELPASATVDWFWTRNDILEAYVNEVYGGHLYSDVRGFKSQAEMYFMKGLDDLNLREQVMLVAAIKKPSRIKEYAAFLKAEELRDLLEAKRPSREAVDRWTEDNVPYKVNRKNYREILETKLRAKTWIEGRMRTILRLLREDGVISADEERDAWNRQKVRFRFAPGIFSIDNRLVNNIKREIDRELGTDSSDSGMVVVTTVDMAMQKKLQTLVDRKSRWISVDPDCQVEGQPSDVLLEGGARIIHAHRKARSGRPDIVNRIVADVGGTTRNDDEWDWISLANRSLGSSLKPILDLYFILSGYNLQDMFKNSLVTYKTYSLEQQKVFQNFIHRYPKRTKEIEGIEKYWSWSPRNFTEYTDDWVTVEDALVHSINGIHVQIQELVTPATFARLLNETMNITEPEGKHQPYRSIILGGSSGDQRYDRYLLAYSMFPNLGVIKKHTFIETIRRSDGAVMRPDYRPLKIPLLDHFGADRVRAACVLIDLALRETVKRGTMAGMEGIGAGKTGTSNELRDAMATVHFIAGDSTYIAGVRLGNRKNYSIGRAADRIAVPMLHDIVTGTFKRDMLMRGDDYDDFLRRLCGSSGEIVRVKDGFYLKGNYHKPRRLEITRTQEEIRNRRLSEADAYYRDRDYEEAARSYEDFLALSNEFNARHPAFEKMVHCFIKTGNLKRAAQIIERFSLPGRIWSTARAIERKHDVTLKVNEDFYSGDNDFERRKHEKEDNKKKKRKRADEEETEEAIPDEIKNRTAPPREEKQADAPLVPQEKKAEPDAQPQDHKDAPPAREEEKSE